MDFGTVDSGDHELPLEKQRQLYFLGMGLYSAIFWINVIFYAAYRFTTPHIAVVRILDPVFTFVFTVVDTIFLRSICRKQFPTNPELLEKWPVSIAKYATWPYFALTAMSLAISLYLLSQL